MNGRGHLDVQPRRAMCPCVPSTQSLSTKPAKPHSPFRMSLNKRALWSHHCPLTRLYAVITEANPGVDNRAAKMREINLSQGAFVHSRVDAVAGPLDGVRGEVLGAGEHAATGRLR